MPFPDVKCWYHTRNDHTQISINATKDEKNWHFLQSLLFLTLKYIFFRYRKWSKPLPSHNFNLRLCPQKVRIKILSGAAVMEHPDFLNDKKRVDKSSLISDLFYVFNYSWTIYMWYTLTSLSHPEETITGFWGRGENRTHETHSECPCSWMVYLQIPKVFHNLMVRSRAAETIWRLSAEKATERTSLVCPTNRRVY